MLLVAPFPSEGSHMLMTRTLRLTDEAATSIPVRVFAPVQEDIDWACTVAIDWPNGAWERKAFGIDAIQSIELALRSIRPVVAALRAS